MLTYRTSIVAMDDYAIKTLEAIEKHEKERSVVSAVIYPFSASPASRKKLIETFNQAAGVLESNLRRLVSIMTHHANRILTNGYRYRHQWQPLPFSVS